HKNDNYNNHSHNNHQSSDPLKLFEQPVTAESKNVITIQQKKRNQSYQNPIKDEQLQPAFKPTVWKPVRLNSLNNQTQNSIPQLSHHTVGLVNSTTIKPQYHKSKIPKSG